MRKKGPIQRIKKKKRFRERNKNKFSLYNFSANYKQKVENRIKALFNLYIMTQLNNQETGIEATKDMFNT